MPGFASTFGERTRASDRPLDGRARTEKGSSSTVVVEDRDLDLERPRAGGAVSTDTAELAGITRRVLQHINETERYRAIGRIAVIVARLRTPRSEHERPWVAVTDSIEIEDWSIERPQEVGIK